MSHITYRLVVLVLWAIHTPTFAQTDCRYNSIRNLALSQNAVLSWDPAPYGDCTISYYMVFIKSGNDDEKRYTTEEPLLDGSFLPICVNTRFVVVPVSPDDVQGGVIHIFADTPTPPNVNLTVTTMVVSHIYEGVLLSWEIEEKFRVCAKRYRVLIYDETNDLPVDVYVSYAFMALTDLIPCNSYQFGITALYNIEEEGPVFLMRYTADPAVMSTPKLRDITLGKTSVDLIWQMESVSENRCAVSSITISSLPYFRIQYIVRDQNSRTYFPTSMTDLQPDTMYLLNVTVTNTAGTTDPVIITVQTLPSS